MKRALSVDICFIPNFKIFGCFLHLDSALEAMCMCETSQATRPVCCLEIKDNNEKLLDLESN